MCEGGHIIMRIRCKIIPLSKCLNFKIISDEDFRSKRGTV